jgi:hypothetical protein
MTRDTRLRRALRACLGRALRFSVSVFFGVDLNGGHLPVATATTQLVWPVSGSPTGVPVARSHTRTVASWLPVTATTRPSASTVAATATTRRVWPVSGSPTGVALPALPQPDQAPRRGGVWRP